MKWPWKPSPDLREKAAEATEQAEKAKSEYKRTVGSEASRVSNVLSFLLYQAEQNRITESIQKVARGH